MYLGPVFDHPRARQFRQGELDEGEPSVPVVFPFEPDDAQEQAGSAGVHRGRCECPPDRCWADLPSQQAFQLALLQLLRYLLVYAGLPEDSRLLPVGGDEPGEEEEDPRY